MDASRLCERPSLSVYVLAYDHQGRHYKTIFTLYGNPAFNPGNEHVRAPRWLAYDAINHDTGRANFSQMHRIVVDDRVPETLFTSATSLTSRADRVGEQTVRREQPRPHPRLHERGQNREPSFSGPRFD